MNANELAEAMETRAAIRRKITSREDTGDRLSDQLDQAASMLRQQEDTLAMLRSRNKDQALEIEALNKKLLHMHSDLVSKTAWSEHLERTQDYLYKQHDADKAEINALREWQDTWRPFLKKHFGVEQ